MHHRSLAMRYSLFSMLHRWFSMHHRLLSMRYRIPTNVVAKLQLNSDIPTNRDKIFIVFPVFLFLPLPSRRAHLHKIYDHLCENYDDLCENYDDLHKDYDDLCENYDDLYKNYDDLCEDYDDLHKNYDGLCENYNHLCVLAVSLRHPPQALFAPKEHLPTPVLVKGVTTEVLIFSAETLVV